MTQRSRRGWGRAAAFLCSFTLACVPSAPYSPATPEMREPSPPDPAFRDCGVELPPTSWPQVEPDTGHISLDLLVDAMRVKGVDPGRPALEVQRIDSHYTLGGPMTAVVLPWADLPPHFAMELMPEVVREDWYWTAMYELEGRLTQRELGQAESALQACRRVWCDQIGCLRLLRDARQLRHEVVRRKAREARERVATELQRSCASARVEHRATLCLVAAWAMSPERQWTPIEETERLAAELSDPSTPTGWFARYLQARPRHHSRHLPSRAVSAEPLLQIAQVRAPSGGSRADVAYRIAEATNDFDTWYGRAAEYAEQEGPDAIPVQVAALLKLLDRARWQRDWPAVITHAARILSKPEPPLMHANPHSDAIMALTRAMPFLRGSAMTGLPDVPEGTFASVALGLSDFLVSIGDGQAAMRVWELIADRAPFAVHARQALASLVAANEELGRDAERWRVPLHLIDRVDSQWERHARAQVPLLEPIRIDGWIDRLRRIPPIKLPSSAPLDRELALFVRARLDWLWRDCAIAPNPSKTGDMIFELSWGNQGGWKVRSKAGGSGAEVVRACMQTRGTRWIGDIPRAFRAELSLHVSQPPP